MAYTWGSKTLKIIAGTYQTPICDAGINVIDILPDTSGSPASVIQQGGRSRMSVSFDAYFTTYSDYTSLRDDFVEGTERIFAGPDSFSDTMIISSLSAAILEYTGFYRFSITLLEV